MSSRDNWERLVAAVLKREQLWQLCHAPSRSPSISSIASDSTSDFSGQIPNNSLNPISVSPPPSVPQVSNNASGPRKLFSAWYRRRKQKAEYWVDVTEDIQIHLQRVRRFSLSELQVATVNFSNKNVIEHKYNMVYKGWLADGSPVAVRRYKDRGGSQSEEAQFQKVVEVNSIAAHPNVLHVLGFCTTPKELLLVYPLMVNGSVASFIRGKHKSQAPLNWPIRKGIALGAARGLAYLHEECNRKIIHRNIKAANVLLDEDFEAFIADFELAIIMDHDDTYFEDEVRGTFGHIAPEYLSVGRSSEKTDVFGYGVFLLELITGQRAFDLARLANDDDDVLLLDWVKGLLMKKQLEAVVDADLRGNYIDEEVEQLIQLALLCTQSSPVERPKMSEVVRMLEGDSLAESWEAWQKEETFH